MQKFLLYLQMVVFYLFGLLMIISFVYGLGFMTEYKTLFQQFGGGGDFHDEVLQPFNREIFSTAILLVLGTAVLFMLKVGSKVVDNIALVAVWVVGLYAAITSIPFMNAMNPMALEYNDLDFTMLLIPVGDTYVQSTFTFELGELMYLVIIILSVCLILLATFNTVLYRVKARGGQDNE